MEKNETHKGKCPDHGERETRLHSTITNQLLCDYLYADGGVCLKELKPITEKNAEKRKTHIGDGAYVSEGSWQGEIIVYCSDGIKDYNQISIEMSALKALLKFVKETLGWRV